MFYHLSMDKRLQGTIVFVDDESMVTSAFKMLLKVEGFTNVFTFNNPHEALDYINNNQPDLIVSDFMMPQMNGLEFLTQAKEICPDTSMILLTGYADKENAIRAINEIGLYKYIEKPWDNTDLVLNIKNGIERSHLLENLQQKIRELADANDKLKIYSQNLESLVAERTKDLQIANSKLAGIISYCADGIIIVDENGNIEQINPAGEFLAGLSEKSLISKPLSEILFLNSKTNETQNIFDILKQSDRSEILIKDCFILNKLSNEEIPVEINFASISEDIDNKNKFVGVIRNVTEQKETEKLRDDFIATLTHDMRTPLLAAIQTLKFFIDGAIGELTEQQKLLLSTMLQSNEDLLGLVNALLEVYRFESGKLTLCKTIFSPIGLVQQCYEELKPLAQNKNLKFNLDIQQEQAGDYNIEADRSEIKRVITNLCGNALNYTNTGGEINIIVKIQHGDFIFSVCDNGNGIPKADIPNLFKRFSQGTMVKRSTGTGLGLYLSRQIIEAHNGKIWVDSKLNKGSEFTFILTDVVKKKNEVQNG